MKEKEPKTNSLHEQSSDVEQLGEIAHEKREAIHDAIERAEHKHNTHRSAREVLAEARKLAEEVEETSKDAQKPSTSEKRWGPITKRQLDTSFKSQMKSAENEMSTVEHVISRLIHSKAIEKSADLVSSTLARPNAMLSGSIAAFIGITLIYFVSKNYGFQLTGFETIGAFIVGWVAGLLYDYFSIMFRGRR